MTSRLMTGASRPVPWLPGTRSPAFSARNFSLTAEVASSWYSSSTLTSQTSWVVPVMMFSTVSMAVNMEWSWLLYRNMPLRPTGWTFDACSASQPRRTSTLAR